MGDVIRNIPRPPVDRVIVVKNGSKDRTEDIARETCAGVIRKGRCMYDRACLAGIESARDLPRGDHLHGGGWGEALPAHPARSFLLYDRPFPGRKMSFCFHLSVDFLMCKMLNETKGFLPNSR
jgi:glycosyltransferase involved in cell wall biosynthesis